MDPSGRAPCFRCCARWRNAFRIRSELFHYEVRSTYDTPEIAESRRIVDDAKRLLDNLELGDSDSDEPWRRKPEG
jgi:hypothetical protein